MNRKKRSVIWNLDKESLEKVVKNSKSLTEILKYFGLSMHGGNSNTLKKRLVYDNIDFSHIKLTCYSNLGRKFYRKKPPLETILTINSTYDRGSLKKRIINEKIIDYRCEQCGLSDTWQNKKITLQLEHKNGIYNDNRIENLCFLCPNCHSQTQTFAGRNAKTKPQKYFCSCGKEIRKTSKNCYQCHGIKIRKVELPSKEQLLLDIKNLKSNVKIGKKYGVTDNAIKKWKNKYSI